MILWIKSWKWDLIHSRDSSLLFIIQPTVASAAAVVVQPWYFEGNDINAMFWYIITGE
jgi:hypothetical protein